MVRLVISEPSSLKKLINMWFQKFGVKKNRKSLYEESTNKSYHRVLKKT